MFYKFDSNTTWNRFAQLRRIMHNLMNLINIHEKKKQNKINN